MTELIVNTLRYRIRRVRELTGLDLRNSSTRVLTELNLCTWIQRRVRHF